jgi:hypothetical protein
MSNRKRDQQPIPQPPRKPTLLDALITFQPAAGGDTVCLHWSAANGDITCNGQLVHNTNDLALLHTVAKGILASKGGKP